MRQTLRHLLPGLGLIAAASALLLLSDLGSRNREDRSQANAGNPGKITYTHDHPARLGILQPTSNKVMDDMCKGLLDALASRGYRNGENLQADVLIAQGDAPTMAMMAQKITSGTYDLGASISTLCLQSLAAADQKGRLPMVFCGVTSPVAANVGVKSMDSLDKPAYMTGYGTAQPVEAIFREAVAANPKLKKVGVVWNPAEVNSLLCTERARAICQELGLTLLEAPIEGSKDVREAADLLVARGAEAFWTGGDATVIAAYEILQQSADKAHIPIFSNISGQAQAGALFDFGANYYQVGYAAGQLAADILDGHSPATLPVHDLMPGRLGLNEKVLASLRDAWTFTPDQYNRAGYVVTRTGEVRETKPAATTTTTAPASVDARPAILPPGGKLPWRVEVIQYTESAPNDEAVAGLTEGLKQSGLVEGRDYVLLPHSAQGDMSLLSPLFDAAAADGADLYVTLSTPTLQTAVRKVRNRPLVFTLVSDPIAAGAGVSATEHPSNLSGICSIAPIPEMIALIKANFPSWKILGTLYCPAEVNSVVNLKLFTDAAQAAGLQVVAVPANTVGDLPDAALALAGKNLDAVVQISDNLSATGFSAIARACRGRRLPLFAFQSMMVAQGAALAYSTDYHQQGLDAAAVAARVLRGDSLAGIPFTHPSKQVLLINLSNARAAGLTISPALQQRADRVNPNHGN